MQSIESLNKEKILKNIEGWKRKLLDFTKRNNLIYFNYSKKVHLKINEQSEYLYNALINENKIFFIEKMDLDFNSKDDDLKELKKLLSKLRLKANSILKEKGINTLYICLGMLKWRESESSKIDLYAPLLLLPVQIIKEGKNKPFILKSRDGEVVINNSLMYKMKLDFGIDLYEDQEEIISINIFFEKIKNRIKEIKNWNIEDEVFLGNFKFSKISMYEDLVRYESKVLDHEIVSRLAGFEKIYDSNKLEEIDKLSFEKKSEEIYQVLDADSSQQKTLAMSKQGYSFVIEGPPGTGKSQTIGNIIAEAIAYNKKVLFVSEKAAALEVVANRLDSVGLGDYILELHSNKVNKKLIISNIYSEFIRRKNISQKNNVLFFNELDEEVRVLGKYIDELHKKYLPLNKSAFDLHGELALLSSISDLDFLIRDYEKLTVDKIIDMQNIARELEDKHNLLYKFKDSLWTNISINSCSIQKQKDIESLLYKLHNIFEKFNSLSEEFVNKSDIRIHNINELYCFREGIRSLNDESYYRRSFFYEEKYEEIDKLISINKDAQLKYKECYKELEILYKNFENFKVYENEKLVLKKLKSCLNEEGFNDIYINEYRIDSIVNIEDIILQLTKINNISSIFEVFGQNQVLSINKIKYLLSILELLKNGYYVPYSWFNNRDHLQNIKNIELPAIKESIESLKNKIEKVEYYFNSELYRNNRNLLIYISNLKKDLLLRNKSEKLYSMDDISKKDLNRFEKCINELDKYSKEMLEKLGINSTNNLKNIEEILLIIKLIEETPYYCRFWFENNQLIIVKKNIGKLKKDINQLKEKRNEIEQIFNETIYTIDYLGCYERYRNQYSGKLRIFNSNYKKDKRDIERCLKNNTKNISYEILLSYLEKLVMYEKEKDKFYEYELNYINIFGPLMDGIDTDIEQIIKVVNNLELLLNYWNKYGRTKEIIDFAVNEKPKNEIIDLSSVIKYNINIYNFLVEKLEVFYGSVDELYIISLTELYEKIKIENDELEIINKCYSIISDLSNYSKISFECLIDIVDTSLEINKCIEILEKKESEYKKLLGDSYIGLETDWNLINSLIEFTMKVENSCDKLSFEGKNKLIKYITEKLNTNKQSLIVDINEVKQLLSNLDFLLNRFIEINRKNYIYTKSDLEELNIKIFELSFIELLSLIKCLNNCINNLVIDRKYSFSSVIEIEHEINLISDFMHYKQFILSFSNECELLFGGGYKYLETDWNVISSSLNEIKKFISLFNEGKINISNKFIEEIINTESRKELINNLEIISYLNRVECEINELLNLQNNEFIIDGTSFIFLDFSNCRKVINKLITQIEDIETIIKIRNIINRSKEINISDFVYLVLDKLELKDNYLDIFNKRLNIILLDNIYNSSIILSSFDREKFERTLNNFRINDKKLIDINVDRIKCLIDNKITDDIKNDNFEDEFEILSHENSKKKRHLPLRLLFSSIPNVLRLLKPCIMMSPLSVSEFIDLDKFDFDMVIFDEASQICPEDAIGAMLRGNQIIIAGDKKQLPPTKFFDNSQDESEEYDTDNYESDIYGDIEYESILDLSSTFMKTTRLLWHYRSRHESLITFSNMKFYDNSLYTFPSMENNDNLGVKFEFVNGVYDQGGSSTNIIEAKRVADLVIEHFRKNPNKSLGVITFGAKQMDCIQDMIEKIRKNYPELDKYFDEEKEDAFFVKNLENVQGDERDTIILSVCYGYSDESRSRLNHNFGPINKAGGERRLNVAITRAKYKLILVSSITDSDIDISRTQSIGANLLKEYLYFARTGKIPESISIDNKKTFDSPLEKDIFNELIKLGYEIDTQVGCSGYRIDLAIKDPNNRGNYILGIECDGATYHSSKSARDRDRLRQEVLEGLGWEIHRIWSQDWFKNKKKEIIEIKEKIIRLISK